MPLSLETPRLILRPLPAAAAAVLPGDRDAAAQLIGAPLDPDWPLNDIAGNLRLQAVDIVLAPRTQAHEGAGQDEGAGSGTLGHGSRLAVERWWR